MAPRPLPTGRFLQRKKSPAPDEARCSCCFVAASFQLLGCTCPCAAVCCAPLYSQGWLLALVDIPEEAAEGVIVHATGIMSSMLTQRQLPEATTNLVSTLAHLHSDELPRHGLLLLLLVNRAAAPPVEAGTCGSA